MFNNISGTIKPNGWIKEFLLRDRDGITGNLDALAADAACGIFEDKKVRDEIDGFWSSWWPGETEGNWRDAYARLAYALDDKAMIENIDDYVDRIISFQGEDGYIGIFLPNERFGNGARSGELWTQSRIMAVFLTSYFHTRKKQILDALERMADLIVRQYGPLAGERSMYAVMDEDGSKAHGLMIVEPLLMLYELLGKAEYLEFCEFLYEDYSIYAMGAKFPCYDLCAPMATDPVEPFVSHGPHTCEQLRIPLLLHNATKKPAYLAVFNAAYEKLKKNLCLSGSCKSDEQIGAYQGNIKPKDELPMFGKGYPLPGAGYEYCSTTELMFTFNRAICLTGDLSYADREEWMVMNAGMAARHHDGKSILYLSSDNLYLATKSVGDRWDYSPTHIDAAVCCAPNSGKLIPHHLESMWMTDEEGRLAAVYYGPCTLDTVVGGKPVRLVQKTQYPFENTVVIEVESEAVFSTEFLFRVPEWCDHADIVYNGKEVDAVFEYRGSGRVMLFKGEFGTGDTIALTFRCNPKTLRAADGTMALAYGSLLYSLDIPAVTEEYYHYDRAPFCDMNLTPDPAAKWDYTLLLGEGSAAPRPGFAETGEGYPWEMSPIALECVLLSAYGVPEPVKLMPIGCTLLRRTAFPFVDERKDS